MPASTHTASYPPRHGLSAQVHTQVNWRCTYWTLNPAVETKSAPNPCQLKSKETGNIARRRAQVEDVNEICHVPTEMQWQ